MKTIKSTRDSSIPVLIECHLSLIHISEPTRRTPISYAVFCLKKIFLMIRRPPRSTLSSSSAASDVYKRQWKYHSLARIQNGARWMNVSMHLKAYIISCSQKNEGQFHGIVSTLWLNIFCSWFVSVYTWTY